MRGFLRIFLGLLLVLVCVVEAYAVNPPAIYINKINRTLNFGNVTKQSGVDVTSTVVTASGGKMNIRNGNGPSPTINITFQSCGLTSDNVQVKDFTATYGATSWTVPGDGPYTQTGLPAPAGKGTSLTYGAKILVKENATTGALTPCFNITLQYDCFPATCTNSPVIDNETAAVTVIGIPMLLNDIQTMDFGPMTKPTVNSTVIMQPNGTMNVATGNTVLINGTGGSAGQFTLVAEKNVAVGISIANGVIASGMGLINMTASFNNSATTAVTTTQAFTTNNTGNNNLKIGGTLSLLTTAVTGTYNVPYTITVNYQ